MKSSSIVRTGAVALAFALCGHGASAADVFWKDSSGGAFGADDRWSTGNPPGESDVARLRFTQTAPVTFDRDYTVSSICIGWVCEVGFVADLDIGAGHTFLSKTAMRLDEGSTVRITSGTMAIGAGADYSYFGDRAGYGPNTLIVTGADSAFKTRPEGGMLFFGSNRWGNSLRVENGALFEGAIEVGKCWGGCAGSNNTVMVTGAGSRWVIPSTSTATVFTLGTCTPGNTMTITDHAAFYSETGAATLNFSLGGIFGDNPNDEGRCNRLTVSDSGTMDITGILYAGQLNSSNHVEVLDGGRLCVHGVCYIGYGANGWTGAHSLDNTLSVNGADSSFVMPDGSALYVGYVGSNGSSLEVLNGAAVVMTNGTISVGYANSASGSSMVVSNAVFEQTHTASGEHRNYIGYNSPDASLTVFNSTFLAPGAFLCSGSIEDARRAEIRILGGSVVTTSMAFIGDHAADSTFELADSQLTCAHEFGLCVSGGTNGLLYLHGTNTSLKVTGDGLFKVAGGSTIRFDIPKDGFLGNVVTCLTPQFLAGTTIQVNLDPAHLSKARYVLVRSNYADIDVSNVQFVLGDPRLSIDTSNPKELAVKVKSGYGTTIIIR